MVLLTHKIPDNLNAKLYFILIYVFNLFSKKKRFIVKNII